MEERKNWIIVIQDSNCSGADAIRVNGTTEQVKEYLVDKIVTYKGSEERSNRRHYQVEGTETVEQLQVWDKGKTLRGFADLGNRGCLVVIASLEKEPVLL